MSSAAGGKSRGAAAPGRAASDVIRHERHIDTLPGHDHRAHHAVHEPGRLRRFRSRGLHQQYRQVVYCR